MCCFVTVDINEGLGTQVLTGFEGLTGRRLLLLGSFPWMALKVDRSDLWTEGSCCNWLYPLISKVLLRVPLEKNCLPLGTKLAMEIAFAVSGHCLRHCSNCCPESSLPLFSLEREAYFWPILVTTWALHLAGRWLLALPRSCNDFV